jgi:hypothetical protein
LHYHQERVYQLVTSKRSYSNKVSAHKLLEKDSLDIPISSSSTSSSSSSNALIQAIQDEYIRGDDDRRLLLLQQFLEYLYSQRKHKLGNDHLHHHQLITSTADRMLQTLAQASSWFSLSQSEWSHLFPSSDDHHCYKSLHPLAHITSYLAIERRKTILLWQEKNFQTICQQIYDKEVVIISPDMTMTPSSTSTMVTNQYDSFSVVGSFTQNRTETIEATLRVSVQSIFSPLVEYYSLLSHLQDTPLSFSNGSNGSKSDHSELSLLFRSTPKNRNILETLRVLTWLIAGTSTGQQTPSVVDQPSPALGSSEQTLEGEVDEFSKIDSSLSMLKKMNIAAHCSIPSDLREKILSTTLRCLSSLSEKYLYLCLNRSSDGTLRENCGRRQMFIDLAGAFSELSLLLTDMYREGLIQADGEEDNLLRNGTKAHDYVNSLIFGKFGHDTPKQKEIETQISHRNDLVETARWVLKLEMAILTEDWDNMDTLSTLERPKISLPQCPGIIEVSR